MYISIYLSIFLSIYLSINLSIYYLGPEPDPLYPCYYWLDVAIYPTNN